uniref:Uncharacterized protein n=1 Tax=Avena sativa TaxID=4498 RepID=A0ACD5W3A7_AVESA
MQPGEGRGKELVCTDQGHPPATGHRDTPFHSPPPSSPAHDLSPSENKLEEEEEEDEQTATSLPEDALVEILARVPYRSLCRFKCVSKPWLALCSATDIRRRSPQTLSGFFHLDIAGHTLKFRNLSGRGPPMVDPSLRFLHESYDRIQVEQCCSSLLLCQCWNSSSEGNNCDYVVCNPATDKWTVLPLIVLPDQEDGQPYNLNQSVFLGFDTIAPSRFVVFVPVGRYGEESAEVAIYSSETGRWTSVQSEWGNNTVLVGNPECVFLNGTMHLTTYDFSVATVDTKGKIWRKIEIPRSPGYTIASIGHSQGRLCAWRIDDDHDCQLYVWVLEDYDSGKWTLKHTVNVLELFGRHCRKGTESYTMFAIHPECNLFFLTDGEEMTVSYDMDSQKVQVISTSKEFLYGLPYTPCFAE